MAYNIYPTVREAKQRAEELETAYEKLLDAFTWFDRQADRVQNATTTLSDEDRSYIADFRLKIDAARCLVDEERSRADVIVQIIETAIGEGRGDD